MAEFTQKTNDHRIKVKLHKRTESSKLKTLNMTDQKMTENVQRNITAEMDSVLYRVNQWVDFFPTKGLMMCHRPFETPPPAFLSAWNQHSKIYSNLLQLENNLLIFQSILAASAIYIINASII